jgi:DNA polymerase type B, organellar and viral.
LSEKDVEVLQKGYIKFGEMLKDGCNMDITNFMSSAQLAHQYMLENEVFEGVNQLSSTPREYIMKCVVGGRTMCAENKMQHIKGIIDDFDAVSLYPSAMSRLGGYLIGSPKVLENRSYGFLKSKMDILFKLE